MIRYLVRLDVTPAVDDALAGALVGACPDGTVIEVETSSDDAGVIVAELYLNGSPGQALDHALKILDEAVADAEVEAVLEVGRASIEGLVG